MHDVLSKVVAKEADKLLKLADQADPLSGATLEALEILCRCAKALKTDAPPGDAPPVPGDTTVEGDLKLVTGNG